MGSEGEVVRQKVIFLDVQLQYSVQKSFVHNFFPIIHSFIVSQEGEKKMKFYTLVTFFELSHHFRAFSHYRQLQDDLALRIHAFIVPERSCCNQELLVHVTGVCLMCRLY